MQPLSYNEAKRELKARGIKLGKCVTKAELETLCKEHNINYVPSHRAASKTTLLLEQVVQRLATIERALDIAVQPQDIKQAITAQADVVEQELTKLEQLQAQLEQERADAADKAQAEVLGRTKLYSYEHVWGLGDDVYDAIDDKLKPLGLDHDSTYTYTEAKYQRVRNIESKPFVMPAKDWATELVFSGNAASGDGLHTLAVHPECLDFVSYFDSLYRLITECRGSVLCGELKEKYETKDHEPVPVQLVQHLVSKCDTAEQDKVQELLDQLNTLFGETSYDEYMQMYDAVSTLVYANATDAFLQQQEEQELQRLALEDLTTEAIEDVQAFRDELACRQEGSTVLPPWASEACDESLPLEVLDQRLNELEALYDVVLTSNDEKLQLQYVELCEKYNTAYETQLVPAERAPASEEQTKYKVENGTLYVYELELFDDVWNWERDTTKRKAGDTLNIGGLVYTYTCTDEFLDEFEWKLVQPAGYELCEKQMWKHDGKGNKTKAKYKTGDVLQTIDGKYYQRQCEEVRDDYEPRKVYQWVQVDEAQAMSDVDYETAQFFGTYDAEDLFPDVAETEEQKQAKNEAFANILVAHLERKEQQKQAELEKRLAERDAWLANTTVGDFDI